MHQTELLNFPLQNSLISLTRSTVIIFSLCNITRIMEKMWSTWLEGYNVCTCNSVAEYYTTVIRTVKLIQEICRKPNNN